MEIVHDDNHIHVVHDDSNVYSVIEDITDSGVQEEAFYVCDLGDIVAKHTNWMHQLPKITPFYAVKCNPTIVVLETLAALGAGFDCASKREIALVLSLGVSPERIIYANPTKPETHLKYAATVGVRKMTFDNDAELYKIRNLCPNAKTVLRIRCDDPEALFPLGTKFGCDPVTEAPHLLQLALELGVNVIGVSFHIGSDSRNALIYRQAIRAASETFQMASSMGFRPYLLDIGGGYSGRRNAPLNAVAAVISAAVDDYFGYMDVRVIAEPGRYYVASAFTLATKIHSIRTVVGANADDPFGVEKHVMYYVNTGVYNGLLDRFFDVDFEVRSVKKSNTKDGCLVKSTVWGPTCDSLDNVANKIYLPQLTIGDWICVQETGAYTVCMANEFNGFPIPKIYFIADERTCMLLHSSKYYESDQFIENNDVSNKFDITNPFSEKSQSIDLFDL